MSSIVQIAKIKKVSSGTVGTFNFSLNMLTFQLRLRLKLIYNISGETRNLQEDINSIDGL